MSFIDEMEHLGELFGQLGYGVNTPRREELTINWDDLGDVEAANKKARYIDEHLEKIRTSNALVIANYSKNGIDGYIGPNSLMEASFGYAFGLPVVFLFDPGQQPCRFEARAIMNICLNGDPSKLQI